MLTFYYDGLNRVIAKVVPDGCAPIQIGACPATAATRDVYFGYDVRGLQTYARFDGPGGEGVTTSYDGYGAVSASTIAMGGYSRTLTSGYDAAGARVRLTHPDGQFVDYNRDALSRVSYAS